MAKVAELVGLTFAEIMNKPLEPGCCTYHDTGGDLRISCGPCDMGGERKSTAEKRETSQPGTLHTSNGVDQDEEGWSVCEDPRHTETSQWILAYCDLRKWYPHKSRKAFKILATSKFLEFQEGLEAFAAWYAGLTITQQSHVLGVLDHRAPEAPQAPRPEPAQAEEGRRRRA